MLGAGYILFSWTPVAFLVVFVVFVGVVTLDLGHLPTYDQPDPKVSGYPFLYNAALVTLVVAVYSLPFWAITTLMGYLPGIGFRPRPREIIAYLGGAALIALTLYADPAGLGDWFFD